MMSGIPIEPAENHFCDSTSIYDAHLYSGDHEPLHHYIRFVSRLSVVLHRGQSEYCSPLVVESNSTTDRTGIAGCRD